jgi:predicted lipoprotein with Yx(FWY)xxD motif
MGSLLLLSAALAACGAYSAPAASAAGEAASPTATANAVVLPSTPSAPVGIAVADTSLGKILVDNNGRTLYMFTKDTMNTSACYDKCAVNWPYLPAVASDMVGAGVNASLIGTATRTDGSVQATYNGMPLYYYAPDTQPGDMKGQGVGGVWFVVTPDGQKVMPAATESAASTPSASVGIAVADTSLGKILVDSSGRTLYLFTKDTTNTSTCYDKCAVNWPYLPAIAADKVGAGVNASFIGTTTRTDGSVQATYNGMPLYYFAADTQPGDTKGQGVGSVWYVVSADGQMIK